MLLPCSCHRGATAAFASNTVTLLPLRLPSYLHVFLRSCLLVKETREGCLQCIAFEQLLHIYPFRSCLLVKETREALGLRLEGNVVIVDEGHNLGAADLIARLFAGMFAGF